MWCSVLSCVVVGRCVPTRVVVCSCVPLSAVACGSPQCCRLGTTMRCRPFVCCVAHLCAALNYVCTRPRRRLGGWPRGLLLVSILPVFWFGASGYLASLPVMHLMRHLRTKPCLYGRQFGVSYRWVLALSARLKGCHNEHNGNFNIQCGCCMVKEQVARASTRGG